MRQSGGCAESDRLGVVEEGMSKSIGESLDKWFVTIPGIAELQNAYAREARELEVEARLAWIATHADQQIVDELSDAFANFPGATDPRATGLALLEDQLRTWTDEGSPQVLRFSLSPPPQLMPLPGGGVALVAYATQFSDIKAVLRQFEDEYNRIFGNPGITPRTLDLMARVMELQAQGLSNSDIAWALLEARYPEIAALDDESRRREYKREHRNMLNRMSQLRTRDLDTLTRLAESLEDETK